MVRTNLQQVLVTVEKVETSFRVCANFSFCLLFGLQLPLGLLNAAQGHPMLVELKNGETLNGHLVQCDTWMNLTLREVVQTSPVSFLCLETTDVIQRLPPSDPNSAFDPFY